MTTFEPTGIWNTDYQCDGSYDIFKALADSKVPLQSGFTHSQINRYMLTANVVQYQCKTETPLVLDFGSGAGTFNSFWKNNYLLKDRKEMIYLGLEVNPSFIADGINNGSFMIKFDANNDDIRKLDDIKLLKPDIVLMQQFVEHIDRKAFYYLLDYVHEMLTNDGLLVLSAPNPSFGSKILEHYHDYEYPLEEIEQILKAYGFKIENTLGWLGLGVPNFSALSEFEKQLHSKLTLVSLGYANSVLCQVNPLFAPYYYLIVRKA